MASHLIVGRAYGGGDFDLSLQQFVLDLSLFCEGCQAGCGTGLLHERSGKERLRVASKYSSSTPEVIMLGGTPDQLAFRACPPW